MWHKWGCRVGCVEILERIRLEMKNIRENVRVTSVIDKIVENKFRWFEHVERKHVNSVVRIVDQMERSQIIRGRWNSIKTKREFIKKDI